MHSVLAARTDFSVGESILTVQRLVDAAKSAGAKVVGLTDTMSVTALPDFTTRAKKADLKPIMGTRLRLSDNPTWRPGPGEKKKHMPRDYFLTVYARTEAGIQAIYRLLTLANSEARFYYASRLGFDDLWAELSDDLIVVLGDGGSVLEHPDIAKITEECAKRTPHVFAPLVPINTPYWGRCNAISIGLCALGQAQPLVIRPSLYGEEEADTQEIMSLIAEGNKITDPWFRSRYNRDMHLMPLRDMVAEVKKAAAHLEARGEPASGAMWRTGLANTETFVNLIGYEWTKQPVTLPVMAPDEYQAVVDACKSGWADRFSKGAFGHKPSAEDLKNIYMPRLKYELSVLQKLSFSGYFLLVQQIVMHAKSNGILVGPGRGSVGGSLVAYLMGITDCDPIRFGLMFERFINPDRIDLPDADLDFMSERRGEIIDYLVKTYGADQVAGVSNFGTLAAASSIRDVGRVCCLPEKDYSVSKFVPKKHGQPVSLPEAREEVPEIESFANEYEAFWPIMERLEGTIRNFSQHAAGVVVAGMPLTNRGVVERRKDSSVICWDKRQVEDQGLVKVDILGLRTLDLIALILDYVKERHGVTLDIGSIPLDDPKVLKAFSEGKTTGVFQFESHGMRKLLRELGRDGSITFEEITATTALYRPGPMESGMMDSFWKRKQGQEPIEYDHALMEPILEETYGVMVYQEQIMRISQVIAGYTGPEADKLRKIMGKKEPIEMAKQRDKFVDGCVATIGADPKWAGALFDRIEGFAGYGFNKSHSVEYSLISYQVMYLKENYPVEFYAAALTLMDADKLPALLKEAKSSGIAIMPPDINHSGDRFEIDGTALYMPFQRIKGISIKTAEAILAAREGGFFKSKEDFVSRVERRRCNVKHQEVLDQVGAFASVEPSQVSATDASRLRDQVDLLPGLINDTVPILRTIPHDKVTKEAIAAIVDDYRGKFGPGGKNPDGMPVKPAFGRNARIMVISDAPSAEEDGNGIMGLARTQSAVLTAMEEAGLDTSDVYWTALIKRPKAGKQVTPDEVAAYKPYLDQEIKVLEPPVIVLVGSITTRTFLPSLKGKASDQAGTIIYSKELDANLVVGFNPGEIYHDPEKQIAMNSVFAAASDLL